MNSQLEEAARSHQARGLLARWRLALVLAAAVAGWLALSCTGEEPQPPSAVIIDQLSLTLPGPAFVEEATDALEAAGYAVDYVPSERVTVDYFSTLPERGYDIVLVRAHAGRRVGADLGITADIFTSELYDAGRHEREQDDGTLMIGLAGEQDDLSEAVFSIPAEFVDDEMEGGFDDATVVLMGCDVLGGERLARAFVERDAGAVVGWDQGVSAAHTDAATLAFLRYLLRDGVSVQEATAAAAAEVGPDPYYGSTLVAYPP